MNRRRHDDHNALRLPPESRDSRRRQVGAIALHEPAVRRFNDLLAQIAPNAPSVSADQLVTLARWLQQQPQDQAVALLSERLGRAEHLRRMLNDSDWDVGVDTRERARMLTSYLNQVDDLIPDDQPLVGHLDDALLVELDRAYPLYGFAQHKGYGTPAHLAALERYGPCPAHRRSFAPVMQAELGF